MYIDGLYASRMTLHIYRDDELIPKEMRDEYITLELTQGQMSAIAAVLGLGYSHGNLLYYKDADVRKNIERTDGFGVQALYHFIICNSRKDRMMKRVNTPLVNSQAGLGLRALKTEEGVFDFIIDDSERSSTPIPDDTDHVSCEDEGMDDAAIMQSAASILGITFSGIDDGNGAPSLDEAAIQTGEPDGTDTPFSAK